MLLLAGAALARPDGGARSGADRFEFLGTYRGPGGLFAAVVAPGRDATRESLYATYTYNDDTFEVVSVDVDTGTHLVLSNPTRGEFGTRSMVAGPDGDVYFGSFSHAHLFRIETREQTIVDLGQPCAGEEFVWDVTIGSDGRVYGGTSPNARVFSYDPSTGAVRDFGRVDADEQFVRYVAAGEEGFVYAGIGTSHMNVAAIHTTDGEHREILPAEYRATGIAEVYRGADGKAYAKAGNQYFRLSGWTATPIKPEEAGARVPRNRTRDGRLVSIDGDVVRIATPGGKTVSTRPLRYGGRPMNVFRLRDAPDGAIYGSTMLPARLLRLEERSKTLESLGELGGGEVYSFLSHGRSLLMAGYGCLAPLMAFDPARPFVTNAGDAGARNPTLVRYEGDDDHWRPLAMVAGPEDLVYVGAIPGYGKLGGPLVTWNVETGEVVSYPSIIPGHSVYSLAVWRGKIVGGTTAVGGSGAKATSNTAKVFLWDPDTKKLVFDLDAVPGAARIDNIAVAPSGLLYGIAQQTMFVVDVAARKVTLRKPLPFPGGTVYGGIALGPDGRLWGLAGHPDAGVFAIDPATNNISLVAKPPRPITGGIAFRDGFIYFASGADVYRYAPPTERDPAR